MKKQELEDKAEELFRKIMGSLKKERKKNSDHRQKEIAEMLECNPVYLNKFENGKTHPSIKIFLQYLLINNFNMSSLLALKIDTDLNRNSKLMKDIALEISEMEERELITLLEITKTLKKLNSNHG